MSAAPETVTAPASGKSTTITALKPQSEGNLPIVAIGFGSLQAFELTQRVAKMFATSTVVPDTFKGNIGNCAIALEMASRMGASPLMVMQNLDVIYGRPSWRAKFLIACFNQCGRFEALSYEFSGTKGKDDWTCVGISKDLTSGKPIRGPEISIRMAKEEGWYDKKGSKWKTIPELMLRYRAGAWLINTTAPEISMGLLTDDEIRDTFDARQTGEGRFEVDLRLGDFRLKVDLNALRRPAHAPEVKNPPTVAEAIAALQKCETLAALEATYTPIVEAFVGNNENVPVEVEAAYGDRKAKLEQDL
jgi:hypothetical protein